MPSKTSSNRVSITINSVTGPDISDMADEVNITTPPVEIEVNVKSTSGKKSKAVKKETTERTLRQQAQIINEYDRWRKHEITWEEYCTFLCMLMVDYIQYRIKILHLAEIYEFKDLMQQGYTCIATYGKKYDPRQTVWTGYFTDYIDQFLRETDKGNGKSKYYSQKGIQLTRVAKSMGYESPEEMAIDDLAVAADLPIKTVIQTLNKRGEIKISLEEYTEEHDIKSRIPGPEEMALKAEDRRILKELLSILTPFEEWLFTTMVLDQDMSFRKLLYIVNKPEFRAEYEPGEKEPFPEKMDEAYLKERYTRAKRKLNRNAITRKNYRDVVKVDIEVDIDHTQASTEDILNCIGDL